MLNFFKPTLGLLASVTASFALLGGNALCANVSIQEPIPAEKIFEAVNQLSQFSQLEALIDHYGFAGTGSFDALEVPFYGRHRHHGRSHSDCSNHTPRCAESHCHDAIKNRTLHITFSTSETFGVLPIDYNVDVTPYAISPTGKKYTGAPTNISISTAAIVQPLNPVFVPKLLNGTYTVGYDVTLGVGSPVAVGNPAALFNAVVITRHVSGLRKETVNSGFVALSFSDLATSSDFLSVSANCELLNHFHGQENDFKKSPNNVILNINAFYGIVTFPVPAAGIYNFTPFAVAPNGKVFRGEPTSLVLATNNFVGIPLNPVLIPHPIYGNYFVGYEVSLAVGSPPAASTVYNFFGSIRSNPVGNLRESVNFPTQQLPLGPLLTSSDFFSVTTNFIIAKP